VLIGSAFGAFYLTKSHAPRAPMGTARAVASAPIAPYESPVVQAGSRWNDADRRRFAARMRALANSSVFPPESAVEFLDPRSGRPLYAHNADLPLAPASTMKLLVAATALRELGGNFRFRTSIVAPAAPQDGTIAGDVYLIGSGDPELSTHDLRESAQALVTAGVRTIAGNVEADASAFEADAVNRSWSADDLLYGWAAPASAVSVDNGAIQFTITPAASGEDAAIDVQPPGSVDRLLGSIATVPAGNDTDLRIDPGPRAGDYIISGQIPEGAPQIFWRSMAHPSAKAPVILRTILMQAGILVQGGAGDGKAPSDPMVLWSHASRPLSAIVQHMWFESDNHYAEQLLRASGAATTGLGSASSGLAAERGLLARVGAAHPRIALVDGSGLSPDNRITARALAAVLRELVAGPEAARTIASLPRVGLDGTVQQRSLAPDVLGRVYGKSGYIEGVTGLAGYIKTRHHGLLIYAFLVNDWTTSLDAVWAAQSQMLDAAARW